MTTIRRFAFAALATLASATTGCTAITKQVNTPVQVAAPAPSAEEAAAVAVMNACSETGSNWCTVDVGSTTVVGHETEAAQSQTASK